MAPQVNFVMSSIKSQTRLKTLPIWDCSNVRHSLWVVRPHSQGFKHISEGNVLSKFFKVIAAEVEMNTFILPLVTDNVSERERELDRQRERVWVRERERERVYVRSCVCVGRRDRGRERLVRWKELLKAFKITFLDRLMWSYIPSDSGIEQSWILWDDQIFIKVWKTHLSRKNLIMGRYN